MRSRETICRTPSRIEIKRQISVRDLRIPPDRNVRIHSRLVIKIQNIVETSGYVKE